MNLADVGLVLLGAAEGPDSSGRSLVSRVAALCAAMPQTPVMALEHAVVDLHAKLEYSNPTSSTKDRSALWIIKRAIDRGDLADGGTIVESSSGNFAIAVATFCRPLGLKFVPVLDPNVNASTEVYLRMLCPRVEKVDRADRAGGYLVTRLARVQQLLAEIPGSFWPNQYENPDAADAHYRFTGAELSMQLGRLDYIFVGVSTGGTIAGLSRRLREKFPGVRVVAVDSAGSAIFGQPPARRRLPGLGSSIVPPLVSTAAIDDVVIVPERAAVAGCLELLHRHGIYAGGSTGSVYAAIGKYFADPGRRGEFAGKRPTVAFLCADSGNAYIETIYNPDWVERFLGPATDELCQSGGGRGEE